MFFTLMMQEREDCGPNMWVLQFCKWPTVGSPSYWAHNPLPLNFSVKYKSFGEFSGPNENDDIRLFLSAFILCVLGRTEIPWSCLKLPPTAQGYVSNYRQQHKGTFLTPQVCMEMYSTAKLEGHPARAFFRTEEKAKVVVAVWGTEFYSIPYRLR